MADGGDGTLQAIHHSLGGQMRQVEVTGPVVKRVNGHWLDLADCSVVELASVCGMARLDGVKEPMRAHTHGLGEVIRHCVHNGSHKIFVALGGSASTDGGMGLLQALRTEFVNENGEPITERGGAALSRVAYAGLVAAQRLMKDVVLTVITDVNNPLLGPKGAARMFAPQKGASEEEVEILERGLEKFADIMEATTGKAVRQNPGTGAAGGTAFGLATALDARIISGFEWLADLLKLDEHLEWADLVISGEGRFDAQSLHGKVLGSLANRCERWEKRLIIVAGSAEADVAIPEGTEVVTIESNPASANDIAEAVKKALAAAV